MLGIALTDVEMV